MRGGFCKNEGMRLIILSRYFVLQYPTNCDTITLSHSFIFVFQQGNILLVKGVSLFSRFSVECGSCVTTAREYTFSCVPSGTHFFIIKENHNAGLQNYV